MQRGVNTQLSNQEAQLLGSSTMAYQEKTSGNTSIGMNRGRGDNFTTELYQMCHPQQSNAYRGSTNPHANKYKQRTEVQRMEDSGDESDGLI